MKLIIYTLTIILAPLFQTPAPTVTPYLLNAQTDIFISEISLSRSDALFSLTYIEIYNRSDVYFNSENIVITFSSPDFELLDNALSDTSIQTGCYILLSPFDSYAILPDKIISSVSFSSSLLIEVNLETEDNTKSLLDAVLFTTDLESADGFILGESAIQSISRKDTYGEYMHTGNSRDDFTFASATPINSALSVAHYIMAEDTVGQAQYKYYPAKGMLHQLRPAQYHYFRNDNHPLLIEARKRYANWARGVGDPDPYNEGKKENPFVDRNTLLLLGFLGLMGLSTVGYILIKKGQTRYS